jgi:hypothetical protein
LCHLLIGSLLVVAPAAEDSLSDAQLAAWAGAAYRDGLQAQNKPIQARKAFARAATFFGLLRRRGIDNPALERNIGQSYLLAGDLPRAILAFRRGLGFAPDDPDLQTLLENARDRVVYTTAGDFGRPPVDNWPPWIPHLSPASRLLLVLTLYSLAGIALTRWWMTRQGWLMTVFTSLFSGAVFMGIWLFSDERQRRWEEDHPLVVIASDRVMLHKGDSAAYPWYNAAGGDWQEGGGIIPADAPALNRGVEARLRFDKGAWVQIELTGGEIGWVRRGEVVIDSD